MFTITNPNCATGLTNILQLTGITNYAVHSITFAVSFRFVLGVDQQTFNGVERFMIGWNPMLLENPAKLLTRTLYIRESNWLLILVGGWGFVFNWFTLFLGRW